jgi:hypothetical protein
MGMVCVHLPREDPQLESVPTSDVWWSYFNPFLDSDRNDDFIRKLREEFRVCQKLALVEEKLVIMIYWDI